MRAILEFWCKVQVYHTTREEVEGGDTMDVSEGGGKTEGTQRRIVVEQGVL